MARVVVEGPCVYLPDRLCAGPRVVGGNTASALPECKFTYVDKSGSRITQDRFDAARDFSEGLAPVQVGKQWGFIDRSGAIVVSPQFEDAEPFASGLSRTRDHQRFAYVDQSGAIRIGPQFQYAESFHEGFAVVGDQNLYWYIDQSGLRQGWGVFAAASPFFKGLAHVKLTPSDALKSGAAFAYIDTTGARVFTY